MSSLRRCSGVGRSYASRVIQTFKAEGVLETRRGSILVRNPEGLRLRACLCNESVKNHFEEVLRGVYPSEDDARQLNACTNLAPKSANQIANNRIVFRRFLTILRRNA